MLIKTESNILSSEITDRAVFESRREFIKAATLLSAGVMWPNQSHAEKRKYSGVPIGPYPAKLSVSDQEDVANYTNYYEFSTNKQDSTVLAKTLKTTLWTVEVTGEVEKSGVYNLEDILKDNPVQERIYRFRCVEAWSMVVPWIGFPLNDMLKRFKPTSKAKFVEFTTLYNPGVMVGQRSSVLDWPYVEGLRMDEAMHPLTMMVTGMYGDELPNQNGAPLRLIVPWKRLQKHQGDSQNKF